MTSNIPARLNFRMPAEWEHQHAVWLAWPHNPNHFDDLASAQSEWLALVHILSQYELVHILIPSAHDREIVLKALQQRGTNTQRIYPTVCSYADVWLRDTGPTFLLQRESNRLGCTHWVFDGWGGAFPDTISDDDVSTVIASEIDAQNFHAQIICEGGAVESNGESILLTTTVVSEGRNPTINRRVIDSFLREFTGMQQLIWLPGKLPRDDTGGHIDNVARFVSPTTVVAPVLPKSKQHLHDYVPLAMNWSLLQHTQIQDGRKLEVLALPHPESDHELCRSYANFFIANQVVIVPQFGLKSDQEAIDILSSILPGHTIVGWHGLALLQGGGGPHCLTQPVFGNPTILR